MTPNIGHEDESETKSAQMNNGHRTTSPSPGSELSVPEHAAPRPRQAAPPAEVSSKMQAVDTSRCETSTDPAHPADAAAPTSAADRATPISAGDRAAPTSAGDRAAPTSAADRTAPTSAGDRAAPTSAADRTAPTSAGDRAAPTSAGHRAAPTSAGDRAAPTSAGDRAAPTSAADKTAPTSAQEPATPGCEAEVRVQDSCYSWVVSAGSALQFMLVGGMHKSFGILLAALAQQRGYSAAQVSVIPATYMALSFLVAPLSGVLCRRWDERVVAAVGGLLSAVGLSLSALTSDINVLYFTNGVLFGLGQGFGNIPCTLIVTKYFVKRRGLANALIATSAAIGGVFFPLLFQALLEEYGIPGTYLIVGGLHLNTLISAALYRPLPLQRHFMWLEIQRLRRRQNNSKHTANESTTTNAEAVTLVLADALKKRRPETGQKRFSLNVAVEEPIRQRLGSLTSNVRLRSHSLSVAQRPAAALSPQRPGSLTLANSTAMLSQLSLATVDDAASDRGRAGCWSRFLDTMDLHLLKEPLYVLSLVGVFLFSTGLPHVCLLVPRFGLEIDISRATTARMIATVAPLDILARLGIGFLLDRHLFHKRYGFLICCWVGATGVLALSFVHNYAGYYAAAVFTYSAVGFYFVVMPVMYTEYYGIDRLSSTLTLSNMFSGVSNFAIQPLCGLLRDRVGSFRPVFQLVAALMYLAGGTVLLHPWVGRRWPPEKREHSEKAAA